MAYDDKKLLGAHAAQIALDRDSPLNSYLGMITSFIFFPTIFHIWQGATEGERNEGYSQVSLARGKNITLFCGL